MTGIRRPFTDEDYAAVIAVVHAIQPDTSTDEVELRHRDATRDPSLFFERWVWEEAGEVVAYYTLTHMDWMFHPDRYYASLMVRPDARGRGIGTTLYEAVRERLRERNALSLMMQTRDDWTESLRFLEQRGHVPGNREVISTLDLTTFDPTRFPGTEERAAEAGVKILSYPELEADPDRDLKLWEFDKIVGADMPMPGEYTVPPFETYRERYLRGPKFYPEGFLIAVDEDGGYAGISLLHFGRIQGRLETGFTGVRREFRGKGVATALKVKVLSAAKAANYNEVRTGNDSTNDAMLGINRRLGFVPLPAWVDYALEPLPALAKREGGV
ncbi:GNAT family N-acetyltransferase [bacterium]|nr:GNAT family N-acetyltransferase [bacterium]